MSGAACPEYSRRLGRIAPAQFQAALDRFGLGRFLRAEPVRFGLFGQNVFVASDESEWVLRGVPHYPWQLPAERFFARLLRERTATRVPWPYLLDPGTDIFGWSYALMPRMPGLQLADPAVAASLGRTERPGVARALGENLAAMQALTWPHSGRYDLESDSVGPADRPYGAEVADAAMHLVETARGANDRTTAADVAWVRGILDGATGALAEPCEPRLVHGDYSEANTTVERDPAGGWRVSGVFDLMDCRFGDGEADVCRQIGLYIHRVRDIGLAEAFLRAYTEARPPRPAFQERLRAYFLYDRLIIWCYWQQHGGDPFGDPRFFDPRATLREWVEPQLAAMTALVSLVGGSEARSR